MKDLPLRKTTTRLLGQILTYYYNAIVDAKVTEEFEQYYRSSGQQFATQGTITQQRAESLLAAGDPTNQHYLIGLAFTMYRTNGYGNYICAKRLQNSLRTRFKPEINQFLQKYRQKLENHLGVAHDYEEEPDGWLPFFGFWMENSLRTFRFANEFAQTRFEYPDKLDKRQVVKACLTVQRQNSRHNLQTCERILCEPATDDPKIKLLREAAQELSDPNLFLRSCAMTQRIAAHSDKTLIGLLKLRFPRTAR